MLIINIHPLFALMKTIIETITFATSGVLFFMSPRLVYRTAHNLTGTQILQPFLQRWIRLFLLESIAGSLLCCGLCLNGVLNVLPITQAVLYVFTGALTVSCLLSAYI